MAEMLLALERIVEPRSLDFGYDASRTIAAREVAVRRLLQRAALLDELLPTGLLTCSNVFQGRRNAVVFALGHRALPRQHGGVGQLQPRRGQMPPVDSRLAIRSIQIEVISGFMRSGFGRSTEAADAEGVTRDLSGGVMEARHD